MKLFQKYKEVISKISPIDTAWFTTFNLDPELLEKFLLPYLGDENHAGKFTSEDFETLNIIIEEKDVKIWYDFRALNLKSPKRTIADFIPVVPADFYGVKKSDAVFHPKVIFLKGEMGAFLITGSANLSIAAWSSNCEAVVVKRIETRKNAKQIVAFFNQLEADTSKLKNWIKGLPDNHSDWDFIYSTRKGFNLFRHISGNELTVWTPYFSKQTTRLLSKVRELGFENITLVPHLDADGRVGILPEELTSLGQKEYINIKVNSAKDEKLQLTHAKVWLTSSQLAVGSWNCSFRATGLDILHSEMNLEAGVILQISNKTKNNLIAPLETIELADIKGKEKDELDKDLDALMGKYKTAVIIAADWETFTYQLKSEIVDKSWFVSLPHDYDSRISIKSIQGRSFKNEFKKLLKNKAYSIFSHDGDKIYEGYLIENGKGKRPAFGYTNLNDLLDSLITDPAGETTNKRCAYSFDDDVSESTEEYSSAFYYNGTDSYYKMFVSFQKLYDKIQDAGIDDDNTLLDHIGYRLPGSLINIVELVKESLLATYNNPEKLNEDNLLYHYFLLCELNRCIGIFNQNPPGDKITVLKTELNQVKSNLNFSSEDIQFIKSVKKEFGYGFA